MAETIPDMEVRKLCWFQLLHKAHSWIPTMGLPWVYRCPGRPRPGGAGERQPGPGGA